MKLLIPLMLILLFVVGCVPIIEPPPAPPNEPPLAEIDSLSATTITEGQTVMFMAHGTDKGGTVVAYSWRSDKDGILSASASFSTSKLSVGNHYIYFKVQDNKGAWSNEPYRIVNVLPPGVIKPSVNSFKAIPASIVAGESATLSWDVSDAQTVTISPDIGNVPAVGTRLLSPKVTTYYTLTVTNKAGSVTEELKMTVSPLTEKIVELFSIAAEEGYVDSNHKIGSEARVGLTKSYAAMQAFFSFDISMIPYGAIINSVSLDLTSHSTIGYPFTYLGAMGIFDHQYGVLDDSDYVASFPKEMLYYLFFDPNLLPNSELLVYSVQKNVDNKNKRFQIRMQFEKNYYPFPLFEDGYLDFVKGKAKLVVHYK